MSENWKTCPECHGEGEIEEECKVCNGEGHTTHGCACCGGQGEVDMQAWLKNPEEEPGGGA